MTWDPQLIYLQPGQMVVARAPAYIKTVLGSCLAITMRSATGAIAAVSHCILPEPSPGELPTSAAERAKYVDMCIPLMLQRLREAGADCTALEVKVFGGADNLRARGSELPYHVGQRNLETALKILHASGLDPLVVEAGGSQGRVLVFYPGSGDAYLKQLPENADRQLTEFL